MSTSLALDLWLTAYTEALTNNGAASEHAQCMAFLSACQAHSLTLVGVIAACQKTKSHPTEVFTPQVFATLSDWDGSLTKLLEFSALAPSHMERVLAHHCRHNTPLPDDVFNAFESSVPAWKYKSHRSAWYQSLSQEQSQSTVRATAEKKSMSALSPQQKETITEALQNIRSADNNFWRETIAIVRTFNPKDATSDPAIKHLVQYAPKELQTTFIPQIMQTWEKNIHWLQEGDQDTNRLGQWISDVIEFQPHHTQYLLDKCLLQGSAVLQSPALKHNTQVIDYLLNEGIDKASGYRHARATLSSWIHQNNNQPLRERAWVRKLSLMGAKISDVKKMDGWTPAMHHAFNYWLVSSFEKHHTKGGAVYTHFNRELTEEYQRRYGIDLRNPQSFNAWREQQKRAPADPFAAYELNAMLCDTWEDGCRLYLTNCTQAPMQMTEMDSTLFLDNNDLTPDH